MKHVLRIPGTVYAGQGAVKHIEEILGKSSRKAVIFTDKRIRAAGLLEEPLQWIKKSGVECMVLDEIPSEPTYMQAQLLIDEFQKEKADFIVAIGGGSVMDIGKLASIANGPDFKIKNLLKDPRGKKQVKSLMIPTTAGTGSEATPNSIVGIPEQQVKTGIVNTEMVADYVILDSEMIRKLPRKIGASTGIDALTHAIECYTSNKANYFSNMFALEAIELILKNIERACDDEEASEAKMAMMIAAFYGGAAITASGTTAVHALSYPLGGMYHIPHGVSNAILLASVMRFNKEVCLEQLAAVYDRLNQRSALSLKEKAEWVINTIERIIRHLDIPRNLKECGVNNADIEELIKGGMKEKRLLDNNRRTVTPEDARRLYSEII